MVSIGNVIPAILGKLLNASWRRNIKSPSSWKDEKMFFYIIEWKTVNVKTIWETMPIKGPRSMQWMWANEYKLSYRSALERTRRAGSISPLSSVSHGNELDRVTSKENFWFLVILIRHSKFLELSRYLQSNPFFYLKGYYWARGQNRFHNFSGIPQMRML